VFSLSHESPKYIDVIARRFCKIKEKYTNPILDLFLENTVLSDSFRSVFIHRLRRSAGLTELSSGRSALPSAARQAATRL
jgi:hypothetical protein